MAVAYAVIPVTMIERSKAIHRRMNLARHSGSAAAALARESAVSTILMVSLDLQKSEECRKELKKNFGSEGESWVFPKKWPG